MLTPQELAAMRFAMSEPPHPGGELGIYEEQVAQWVTEKSFFRDFVYRNAKGKKKGDQLVDGIVLFGDVMFLIEVKAQIGTAKRDDWVRDRLGKALSQLKKSQALLQERQIPKLHNDFYGELDGSGVHGCFSPWAVAVAFHAMRGMYLHAERLLAKAG